MVLNIMKTPKNNCYIEIHTDLLSLQHFPDSKKSQQQLSAVGPNGPGDLFNFSPNLRRFGDERGLGKPSYK